MNPVSYKIYPGIGIARLGDSQDDFFIGPEAPGIVADPGGGSYRDASGRIKRQGVRFRIYELDAAQKIVREITAADAEVTWRAHLVNRKAAGPTFPPTSPQELRNAGVENRKSLIIDAGEQKISGISQSEGPFDGGKFRGQSVDLGNLRTDDAGRLIVLGGHGVSQSVSADGELQPDAKPVTFANNDDWHDDVSDGPVNATVKIDGVEHAAEPAWVVVASPAFAPGIDNLSTWYDEALDVNIRFFTSEAKGRPSFTRDIFPILQRVVLLQWVLTRARMHHGNGEDYDFLAPAYLEKLSSNDPSNLKAREFVFKALTKPGTQSEPESGLFPGAMPNLKTGLNPDDPLDGVLAALTHHNYAMMAQWSIGDFDADWTGSEPEPGPFDQIPLGEQPAALDRAALEACLGGPFFPGIETTYIMAQRKTYERPFRIDRDLPPGSLTEKMSVPWQADYTGCGEFWWPAQRPWTVKRDGNFVRWTPPEWKIPGEPAQYDKMVQNWSKLGFILQEGDEYVEKERTLDSD